MAAERPPAWTAVKGFPGTRDLVLTGVGAVGPDDVWVFTANKPVERFKPRAYHWTGGRWREVALPKSVRGRITEIAAVNGHDIWANVTAGNDDDATTGFLHWNGKAWKMIKRISSASGWPMALTAVAHDDVWALGIDHGADLWHYDGRSWTRRKAGNLELFSLTVGPRRTLWAKGRNLTSERQGIYRFDGRNWKRTSPDRLVPSTPLASADQVLALNGGRIVAFISSRREEADGSAPTLTRLARWDGRSWRLLAKDQPWAFSGPVADRSGGFWFIGFDARGSGTVMRRTRAGRLLRYPMSAKPDLWSLAAAGKAIFVIGYVQNRPRLWRLRTAS